jgi:hypothetical protein
MPEASRSGPGSGSAKIVPTTKLEADTIPCVCSSMGRPVGAARHRMRPESLSGSSVGQKKVKEINAYREDHAG